MENLLKDFSRTYEQQIAEEIYKGDETRMIKNPILFAFIGDQSKDALVHIQDEVLNKWKNGQEILFFQVGENGMEERGNVHAFQVTCPKDKDKAYRHDLYEKIYKDTDKLLELNQTIGQIRNQISKVGNLYASCEQVHICMISQVDDPLNVLVQDIGVLLKSKLSEIFKQVTIDFYGLIEEQEEDNHSINCAMGMSFFRELEYMQSKDFSFKGNIEVLDKDIAVEVKQEGGPLFNLAYLLSNKNEKGILSEKHMVNNYRMIVTMNVLKNRHDLKGFNESNAQPYNDGKFKQQLMVTDDKNSYVSLGLGSVQRPNQRIAFTVLQHFYHYIVERIQEEGYENQSQRAKTFGYDRISLGKTASHMVPDKEKLEDMQGILSGHMKCSEASKQTFKEFENNLYGDVAEGFFKDNFEQEAIDQLEIYRASVEQEDSWPFFWTEKNGEKPVLLELHSLEKLLTQDKIKLEDELDELYNSRLHMHHVRMIPLAEKKNMRKLKKLLFQTIYEKKLEILRLRIQIKLIKLYEEKVQIIYERSIKQIETLNEIEEHIQQAVLAYGKDQDGYLEKNIEEYYKTVVENLLQGIENQRVDRFYFDERFMGNPYALLDKGKEAFIKQLIKVCEEYILSDHVFKESFEEELLNRANVAVKYAQEGTLTKQDLFDKLYFTLQEASNINIYAYRYTQKNPYEEKYYFGDYYSGLIQYIFEKGEQGEHLSVGCVHEKRTSGIEVLRIMGGFHIEDLVYVKACKKYYDLYTREGYLFHGIDPAKLPSIGFNEE